MRKGLIALGSVLLLSGCSLTDAADISESQTWESGENTDVSESSYGAETAATAGVSRAEDPRETSNGVSLIRSEVDRVKDMVSFEGDFVPFEELGFEQYVIERVFSGYSFAADNEMLYFFEYNITGDTGSTAEKRRLLAVYEYNVPKGATTRIEMPEGCLDIIYIDRDYILYYVEDSSKALLARYVQLDRSSGETFDVSGTEDLYYITEDRCVRCGDYLFFTVGKWITPYEGYDGYDTQVKFLTRYSPVRREAQTVGAAELLGAVGDEVITAPFGGMLNKTHYTLDTVAFYASPDELYLGGELAGYVVPTDRNKVFGERFEAGRLFPSGVKKIYKPIFTTAYGVTVGDFLISASSAAAITLAGADGRPEAIVLADTANNKAAVLPKYGDEPDYGFLKCSGDWIYILYCDGKIVAVNTGNALGE